MKRYYSQQTGCTYLEGLHEVIPADAVPMSEASYNEIIRDAGTDKARHHDDHGVPFLVDIVPVALDPAFEERTWRDAQLMQITWLRDRHRDQLELKAPVTLEAEQFLALLTYMQALRDWPQSPDFPHLEHRPTAPLWLAEQTA
ncbi:phage tail assembly chaperone [Pseudomonas poae]|uniref:Phage tail assembly chaperone-like domain-containing protein n=2 Tax=Pseudomonas poae TaxID=200451 RepID=A0ABY0RFW0_9PSED|nr:phage tail assembly chaperone [Pseudomonas poae]KRP52227.1 Caudovirales tail fiber assembly protein [Pseudomonas poae]SDN96214.1 hypothetical protein SAMN04490208_2053 [Pseudomonas poae]